MFALAAVKRRIEVGLCETPARLKIKRLAVTCHGPFEIAARREGRAKTVVRARHTRCDIDRFAVLGNCIVHVTDAEEKISEIFMSDREVGLEFYRFFILHESFVEFPQPVERDGQRVVSLWETWIDT